MQDYRHALTQTDKAQIAKAYEALAYAAEIDSHAHALSEALRHERRQRSCVYSARALLVDCAAQSCPPAAELLSYSDGCRWAALFGARCRCRRTHPAIRRAFRRFCTLAPAAQAAHGGAIRRALDSINGR